MKLLEFFLKARTKTYASGGGKVIPVFPELHQLEFSEGEWLYRDIYNMGNGIFMGLETAYFQNKPVLSVSYLGNFSKMTEEEADKILREALMEKWDRTRLWYKTELEKNNYRYVCDGSGSINEFFGTEKIFNEKSEIYHLYFAGALIW